MAEFFHVWWLWLKNNDLPNWVATGFSLFVWPISLWIIFYWANKRKRRGIPHLETILSSGANIDINGKRHPAIGITFTNRTGSIIYLGRARLREVPKNFPVPIDAARDMSGGWRELKFLNQSGGFADHELILHTNKSAITCMPVSRTMNDEFYSFRPSLWRQFFSLA